MCFSANASFMAAGTLSAIGLLSVHTVGRNKKLIPLAATPLLFGLQQACEGLVWITINNGDTSSLLHAAGTYGFLFFASVWWPVWIPLALFIPETNAQRKKLLLIMIIVGAAAATILFSGWTLQTTGAQIIGHHIDYPVPHYPFGISNTCIAHTISWIISLTYCIAVIVPFFISSIAYAWILGVVIGTGLLVAYLFYLAAFPSVWCFFAAASSVLLYFVLRINNKTTLHNS